MGRLEGRRPSVSETEQFAQARIQIILWQYNSVCGTHASIPERHNAEDLIVATAVEQRPKTVEPLGKSINMKLPTGGRITVTDRYMRDFLSTFGAKEIYGEDKRNKYDRLLDPNTVHQQFTQRFG